MRRIPGNRLELGIVDGKGVPLEMTPKKRSTRLYICGSIGTGKSKMLESLVRQDIKQRHKSKCGALNTGSADGTSFWQQEVGK
jgi:hypothetical protein